MKAKTKYLILLVFAGAVVFNLIGFANPAYAVGSGEKICPEGSGKIVIDGDCKCPSGQKDVGGKCVISNPAPAYLVNIGDFGVLLKLFINIFLAFAGAIAVIFLMIGGFQYVMSRGNEETMEKAKKTVTAAVIGIVLIVMAYAIVLIVNTLLTKGPTGEGGTGGGRVGSTCIRDSDCAAGLQCNLSSGPEGGCDCVVGQRPGTCP